MAVGEGVAVLVGVGVGVSIGVCVGVGVSIGVCVGAGVCVDVGVGFGVAVGDAVGVAVGDAVGVGVGVPFVAPSHPAMRATIHQKARPFMLQLRGWEWAQQSSEPHYCERGEVGFAATHSSAQLRRFSGGP